MATVYLTAAAKQDVRDLDGSARNLVLRAMRKLEEDPEKRGAPLGSTGTGNITGFRKLVVGDRTYRIIYRVEETTVAVVWVVGARADGECYDLAVSRLKLYQRNPELTRELESMISAVWAATTPDRESSQ